MPNASRRNTSIPASKESGDQISTDHDGLINAANAAGRGDRTAQELLYGACHERVYRLAVRMVGLQDAADVTQQTFLQVYRSLGTFDGRSRFETWLFRLTVNESLQHLRRTRRQHNHRLTFEPPDVGRDDVTYETKEMLNEALMRIDAELRSIFLLREADRLSYRDIADILQIPEGTVGSRLSRARHELQRELAELGYQP